MYMEELIQGNYTKDDGTKVYQTDVIADRVGIFRFQAG